MINTRRLSSPGLPPILSMVLATLLMLGQTRLLLSGATITFITSITKITNIITVIAIITVIGDDSPLSLTPLISSGPTLATAKLVQLTNLIVWTAFSSLTSLGHPILLSKGLRHHHHAIAIVITMITITLMIKSSRRPDSTIYNRFYHL